MMRDQAEMRLAALRREYETGQKMLAELERQRLELQQTVLRVSGAIQVLEELLAADEATQAGSAAPGEAGAATDGHLVGVDASGG
jgi:uncharacterized protein (DUF3084 family)